MSARKPAPTDFGPDLLTRYLNVYMESRQMTDLERPWGLGDDGLNEVWIQLISAQANDPSRLNRIIASELTDVDRSRMIETLAPLLFALPLRVFPADLRAFKTGDYLLFELNHDGEKRNIGYLPAALEPAFGSFLRKVLHFEEKDKRHQAVISSGGRRRRVSVSIPAADSVKNKGVLVRFLEKVHSPADEN